MLPSPDSLRRKAGELRALAETVDPPEIRAQLRGLADTFEALARRATILPKMIAAVDRRGTWAGGE